MTRPTSSPNEKPGSAPELDVILPVQFFTDRRRTAWTGELRLMAALLEDALTVCGKPSRWATGPRRHLQRETMRWLRSEDRGWLFSFLRVCESLDLDPGAIRRAVRRHSAGVTGGSAKVAPQRGVV